MLFVVTGRRVSRWLLYLYKKNWRQSFRFIEYIITRVIYGIPEAAGNNRMCRVAEGRQKEGRYLGITEAEGRNCEDQTD